jgi:hypothetical protein
MPTRAFNPVIVCDNNYVYAISCSNAYSGQTTSYIASISSDGSIGSWSKISDGPVAQYNAQAAIVGNKIYFIGGGGTNSSVNTVYSAYFNSGITDYSVYINNQQNTNSTSFNIPKLPVTPNSAYYIKT